VQGENEIKYTKKMELTVKMELAGTKIKDNHAVFEGSPHRAGMDEDMSLAGITVVIALASLIGLWGLTCLASGLLKSDGIIGLGLSWISAVFGF
jgi:hypothetical protein